MSNFTVPTRDQVSENNQSIFDNLQKGLGFVPNLYAYFAKNETALADYLVLQNLKSTLKAKEREVINLVTSEINDCKYCQAAHTAIGTKSLKSEAVPLSSMLSLMPWLNLLLLLSLTGEIQAMKLRMNFSRLVIKRLT